MTPLTCDDVGGTSGGKNILKIISWALTAAAVTTIALSAGPVAAARASEPPGCAYFPVSAPCLAPVIGSLPPCSAHVWVNTGTGWSCVPGTPSNPPSCHSPALVRGSWECLGGTGPLVAPAPTAPTALASPPASPDVVVVHPAS